MANAKNYLAGLQAEFHKKGIAEVQTFVESGPAVTCILNIAEREQADLIAYASHGRTGLASVFYGSVAAGVYTRQIDPCYLSALTIDPTGF